MPALAPDLLRHEIRSLFLAAVKRRRVRESFLPWAMERFNQLPLRHLGPGDDHAVLTLARVHQLSAYDAAYLALAVSASGRRLLLSTAKWPPPPGVKPLPSSDPWRTHVQNPSPALSRIR